jgi:sec-independent protein translocase protein TatC
MADDVSFPLAEDTHSMPLLLHLEELRKRIIFAIVGVLVGFFSCYRKEKSYVLPFLLSTVGLFVAGGLFGYKMVYPASLDFLIGYGQRFQPMITIGEYTKLFATIIIGLGLVFEMPILVFFLALMRVITARWMWRNLRYSILAIFVLAAIVTPTSDILNMCLFAAPMLALYAVSIGVAWLVSSARERGAGAI